MKILLLAAGYGTRLKDIADGSPKPLLPIAGRPLLDHVLERVRRFPGLTEILVVSNDKYFADFQEWAAGHQQDFPVPIRVLNDGSTAPENRLGSVGDIYFAVRQDAGDEDMMVLGGDNLFDFNLEDYLVFARSKAPQVTIGLYDVGSRDAAKEFGVAAIDGDGRLLSFHEKPADPPSSLVSMCLYYFPQASLGLVEQYVKERPNKADKAGDYIHWLLTHHGVYGFRFEGHWYDIGSPESYERAQQDFAQMTGRKRKAC